MACQGEYPLEPTLCDEWCDATRGFSCDFYDPAACVADCEQRGYTHAEACRVPFREALACIRNTPGAAQWQCGFSFTGGLAPPCQTELQALYSCAEE